MLKTPRRTNYPGIISKISELIYTLQREKQKYDTAVAFINHRQLRDTIHYLAQENNHYACELQSQLYMMGAPVNEASVKVLEMANEQILPADTGIDIQNREVMIHQCCDSEKKMIAAYRSILNEPMLPEDIRRVLRYQLNGVLYAFLQLKLVCSTLTFPAAR
ncbi:MAG: DUF2383 domain-containing protein [Chitinophagaceae bacterium]|nr:DUF2383 domain-containing protein [Chitinophagaceae bacterium]